MPPRNVCGECLCVSVQHEQPWTPRSVTRLGAERVTATATCDDGKKATMDAAEEARAAPRPAAGHRRHAIGPDSAAPYQQQQRSITNTQTQTDTHTHTHTLRERHRLRENRNRNVRAGQPTGPIARRARHPPPGMSSHVTEAGAGGAALGRQLRRLHDGVLLLVLHGLAVPQARAPSIQLYLVEGLGCRRCTLLLVRTERNAGGAFLLLFAVAASEASQQPGSEGAGVKKAHGQGGPPAGNCKGECVALGGGHTTPVTCARWGPVWRHAQRLLLVPRCPPGLVLGGIWCGSHVFPCTCTWYREENWKWRSSRTADPAGPPSTFFWGTAAAGRPQPEPTPPAASTPILAIHFTHRDLQDCQWIFSISPRLGYLRGATSTIYPTQSQMPRFARRPCFSPLHAARPNRRRHGKPTPSFGLLGPRWHWRAPPLISFLAVRGFGWRSCRKQANHSLTRTATIIITAQEQQQQQQHFPGQSRACDGHSPREVISLRRLRLVLRGWWPTRRPICDARRRHLTPRRRYRNRAHGAHICPHARTSSRTTVRTRDPPVDSDILDKQQLVAPAADDSQMGWHDICPPPAPYLFG
ncbi:hypothetical protein Purlil1_8172 [Purpureocillium lilacinum]|uniref:Uncharacterized protein n=1 Tax=Purpureocillium lilacinum TaxID=33203 RepID=A0ABR0BUP8_PURLI|nr:hypothetical protein Purlil1_8172 [Purpureocillium lilacinum]